MDLAELIAKGDCFIDQGVSVREIEWAGNSLKIFVKNEPSAADIEFVYGFNVRHDQVDVHDTAVMARQVHRYVRHGEQGEHVIPHDKAVLMKAGLLARLCEQINALHGNALEEPGPNS